jgi:Flp pilus assembly protein TadD
MLMQAKDLVGAAGVLERVLESDPERHDARALLAEIVLHADLAERATVLLLAIPATAPEWVDAQRLLAIIDRRAGELEAAIIRLEGVLQVAPDRKDIVTALAYARERDGQLKRARAELSKAIERWPADAVIRFRHAMITNQLGDDDAALKAMFGVLSVEPDHPGALNFIGYVWTLRGQRLEDAEAYIRKALERRPDNGAIVDSLGWVLFKRGKIEDAEATLRRAVALNPDEGEIHYHLAEVLWAAGRRKEARRL